MDLFRVFVCSKKDDVKSTSRYLSSINLSFRNIDIHMSVSVKIINLNLISLIIIHLQLVTPRVIIYSGTRKHCKIYFLIYKTKLFLDKSLF